MTPDPFFADAEAITWRIVSVRSDGGLVPTVERRHPPELTFLGDGRFSGSTGCNRFFGEFSDLGDGAVTAGPIGTTMMMCPDDLMLQESRILVALGATRRIRRSAGITTFLDEEDHPLLVLEPSDIELPDVASDPSLPEPGESAGEQ